MNEWTALARMDAGMPVDSRLCVSFRFPNVIKLWQHKQPR